MQALLEVIVIWLVANYGLPAAAEMPRVDFTTTAEMAEVRQVRLATAGSDDTGDGIGEAVHSIYDDVGRTVYLPSDWSPARPAQVSMLVHEMVHHLQNAAGLTHDCAAAREKLAYRAQSRWLEMFGTSLEAEFGLDPMTILVRTNCLQ
jgi:hypothetical protein